jgi:hypothetical protein
MLKMIDRRTGEPKASLADPFVQNSVYSYYGAPIPGTMGNIIAYLRRRRALTPSILVNWSTGQLVNWSTGQRESGPSSRAVLLPVPLLRCW